MFHSWTIDRSSFQACLWSEDPLFPGARVQNFLYLRKGEITLLFLIVKVRRDTDTGLRAVVNEDFSRQQFAADFESVRTIDRNCSATILGILRGVDAPAARTSAFKEARGHADGFFANGWRAN